MLMLRMKYGYYSDKKKDRLSLIFSFSGSLGEGSSHLHLSFSENVNPNELQGLPSYLVVYCVLCTVLLKTKLKLNC